MTSERIVYVVDDDVDVRRTLCLIVESAGLQARAFGTGEEFLDAFDPTLGACLLVDYSLPGMNGLQVLDRVGACGAHVPALVISGSDDPSLPSRAMDAGAWAYVPKASLSDPGVLVRGLDAALRPKARAGARRIDRSGAGSPAQGKRTGPVPRTLRS
ncbi:MAG: response regulator [Phycisphaerae bacterium]|jgi:FixJ family two-component response regulator